MKDMSYSDSLLVKKWKKNQQQQQQQKTKNPTLKTLSFLLKIKSKSNLLLEFFFNNLL